MGRKASKISTVAARQYGRVTRPQLLELGLSSRAISRAIASGKLIVVHAGVYAVGHKQTSAPAQAAAAVLACGPEALLSHGSAAALWGMRRRWPPRPEVTVAHDRRRPGIRVHRSSTLAREDIRHHLGIRVTSPARTALEIAPRLSPTVLARAVNDARLAGYLHLDELAELLGRLPRHSGARHLRTLAQTAGAPTRSQLEDEFLAFARRHGLPRPAVNTRVAGYEVDALFARERVIVELDGYGFHRDRRSFERDRERDAATLAAGHVTVRITWERLGHEAGHEAVRLHEILNARRRAA